MDHNEPKCPGRSVAKNYGRTSVGEGSSAHLGDVLRHSQDVTINGGLHLHYASPMPMQAVAMAGKVMEFLDVVDKMLKLGRTIVQSLTVNHESAQDLANLLMSLQPAYKGLENLGGYDMSSSSFVCLSVPL